MNHQDMLDLFGALACGVTALAFFSIHVVTSPHHKNWIALPQYVRRGLWACGALFMVRSVSLAPTETPLSGQHIPPLGLLTTITLAWTICSFAIWICSRYFPAPVWDRLAWAEAKEREDPSLVPLVLPPKEVLAMAEEKGIVLLNPTPDAETKP